MNANRLILSLAFGLTGLAAAHGETPVAFDNGVKIGPILEALSQMPPVVAPEPVVSVTQQVSLKQVAPKMKLNQPLTLEASTRENEYGAPASEVQGTIRTTMVVGRLLVSRVKTQMQVEAFRLGLDLKMEDAGGFLEKTFLVTVRGSKTPLLAYVEWMKEFAKFMNKPD